MTRRIVVIGGLAAGPAAAARAARTDPGAEVTLIEAGPDLAYGVCELPHFLSGQIGAAALVPFTPERFEREKRVRALVSHRAVGLDTSARRVAVRGPHGADREIPYDALVIATGSRPRSPGAGAARPLKTVADAVALRREALSMRGGRAAVLGAGYVGLLAADALAACGLAVTVLERDALPLEGFGDTARRWAAEAMAAAGVELTGGVAIRSGVVEGADLVVAALGTEPEVTLASAARIEQGSSGALRCDERGETSRTAVYAAGDCAEVRHAVTGRLVRGGLATIASRAGRAVGENAAGGTARLPPSGFALAFRAFGLELGHAGVSLAEARSLGFDALEVEVRSRSRPEAMGGAPLLVTLVVERGSGRLLGSDVVGSEGAALRLNLAAAHLARGATVAELAVADLAYAPSFSTLRDPLLVAAGRAERERRAG